MPVDKNPRATITGKRWAPRWPMVRSWRGPSVKTAVLQSRCECQASLGAKLDGDHRVLEGWAVNGRGADRETARAHSSRAQHRLDVSWLCPFCNRNTFRSFARDGLLWSESA
jgi:hypothetical protein